MSLQNTHWLISLLLLVSLVWPVWRILVKAGYSGAWSLIMFFPPFNVIALWVFAYAEWPSLKVGRDE